jgi:hypothetical protein
MASRKKNPTTKKYNRLFHALATVRNGNCPIHHIRMNTKTMGCRVPECSIKVMKSDKQFQLHPDSELEFTKRFSKQAAVLEARTVVGQETLAEGEVQVEITPIEEPKIVDDE